MTAPSIPAHIPARMLNEFTYCRRLAYLMWAQREWADSADTLEGRRVHRRVDRNPESIAKIHERAVHLTSDALGLTAVIDLVESKRGTVRPVDYKRGKKPPIPGGAYEPERVQLCAQALLLQEHGYRCNEGIIYFAGSRQRVRVRFTPELVARTHELLRQLREDLGSSQIPPPLQDSPKCPRCSLVKICLPDEVNFLRGGGPIRLLTVSDPATYPLIIQQPGAHIRLSGDCFVIDVGGTPTSTHRVGDTSHVVLMGGTSCSGPALRRCCERGIPIVHMSGTGWFYGITHGMIHKNVELRARQFAGAVSADVALPVARRLVADKIANARVLLRRNGRASRRDLKLLTEYVSKAERASSAEDLLGIEGIASRLYFSQFQTMLKGTAALADAFRFDARNKRPPRDPVNALLSFAYALLTKDWTIGLYAVGFDPLMGFYHQPRYGRPALALDMMEPFRPVVAESVVVSVLNNGEIRENDFVTTMGGVLLKPNARKRLLAAYERRLATEIRHPVFGYRCTYRRIFEIQARLLGRYLLGEIPELPSFRVR